MMTSQEVSKRLRQILVDLDQVEDLLSSLHEDMCNKAERIAGVNNVRLAFLSTKLMVHRVQLRVSLLVFPNERTEDEL